MTQMETISYDSVLKIISRWSPVQQKALVDDVLKMISPRIEPPRQKRPTLSEALGLLATDQPAPTDAEVKQWLDEHRMEKYG